MRKSWEEGNAVDPRPDSLCFKRLRAIVANLVETLGGDEASRFRTIPLSLARKRPDVSTHVRVRGKGRGMHILFRVGVGNERIDHEIAGGQNVRTVDRA